MYEKQRVELDRLQEKVAKGKISRREFMSRAFICKVLWRHRSRVADSAKV